MTNMRVSIPRRTFLRGLGALVALPACESLMSARALAGVAGEPSSPLRLAFLYVPNGVHMPDWTPSYEGALSSLPAILEPLSAFRRDMTILTGLTHDKGRANGDGPGDHARAAASWLTGSQALKSEGSEIRAGVSVDQVAAAAIGHYTRLPSLEIGAEPGRQAGKCDSGYSCAYSNNISWRNDSTAMAKEINPRAVFERMFGGGTDREQAEGLARRRRYQRSLLDFVHEDARALVRKASGRDRTKLDEYLTAVREIEQRVERAERESHRGLEGVPDATLPEGIPSSYEEHLRLLGDMLVLAFQTDTTRVATYMFANEGSNKPYPFIGVRDGHHTLSHHENDREKQERISRINQFHTRQLAYLLNRLKSTPDGDGNLLDHSILVYGSSISDGNRHNHDDLPVALFGGGCGSILPGRHIRYPQETPMCNLFLSLLERAGVKEERFGDSTGPLRYLEG
ncbi:MAG: DUF1552 domain-containing protein [Verrucomicrobiae bacterium]|nr:DUF1552 domain-containing protein [Verrucomicrobiae bacterium]